MLCYKRGEKLFPCIYIPTHLNLFFFSVSIEENSTDLSLEEKELVPAWMILTFEKIARLQ